MHFDSACVPLPDTHTHTHTHTHTRTHRTHAHTRTRQALLCSAYDEDIVAGKKLMSYAALFCYTLSAMC